MKGWLAAAVVISGLILGWLLVSMDSCGRVYEIDARGRLVAGVGAEEKPGAPKSQRAALHWDVELPEFTDLAAHVRPGDRLDYSTTSAGYPLASLSMATLRVTRNGQVLLTARDGALKFWGAIAGLSAIPLVCWGVVAFWIALAPSRMRAFRPG